MRSWEGELCIPWDSNQTLQEALMAEFPLIKPERYSISLNVNAPQGTVTKLDDPPEPEHHQIFSSLFTLRDFHTLGDFVIQPTDNILQHLYIEKYCGGQFRPTLFIFFHASVLYDLEVWHLGYGDVTFPSIINREDKI